MDDNEAALKSIEDTEERVVLIVEQTANLLSQVESDKASEAEGTLQAILENVVEIKTNIAGQMRKIKSNVPYSRSIYGERKDYEIAQDKARYAQNQIQAILDMVDTKLNSFEEEPAL